MSLWTSKYGGRAINEDEDDMKRQTFTKPEVKCPYCKVNMYLDEYTVSVGKYHCPKCNYRVKVGF